jgi:hypothetical protein
VKNIKSVLLRYGLPLAIFVLLLFLSHLIQNSFGLAGPFMIILMIASAWYFGRGPGLLIALLFEIALDYYGPSHTHFAPASPLSIESCCSPRWCSLPAHGGKPKLTCGSRERDFT